MSFWDDFPELAGTVAGGAGGFFLSGMNPMGAVAGAGIGGSIGGGLGGLFRGNDEGKGQSQAMIDLWNKLGGELPKYQGPAPDQGLTDIERAGFRRAQMEAEGVARGREGAIEQDTRRSMGGVAAAGGLAAARVAGNQGAENRLSSGDLDIAGASVSRGLASQRMLNDFNQRNMMSRLSIAGGQTGALQNEMDRQQYSSAAKAGNWQQTAGAMGDFGTNWLMRQKKQRNPMDYTTLTDLGLDYASGGGYEAP